MSTAQIREELHQYINKADARFIHLVYGMMKEDKKGAAIYTVQGKPLTQKQYKDDIDEARKQYNKELDEAEARIDTGKYISHEDLEKEAKQW